MKLIIAAIAVSLAVVVSGSYVQQTGGDKMMKFADKDFLMKQKFFFEILRNIHMPLQYEEYMMYTKTWVEDMKMYNKNVIPVRRTSVTLLPRRPKSTKKEKVNFVMRFVVASAEQASPA